MSKQLSGFIAAHQLEIELALRNSLPVSSQPAAQRLNDALAYAVFPGGKRLRPLLSLLASRLAGAAPEQALHAACAIEFLHSSSLILDDLPGMDDADLRRNRVALHLAYGEGIAVLAAIALLNQAYALLVKAARGCRGEPCAVESLLREAAEAIGADGMIGGQAVDLDLNHQRAGRDALVSRDLKTVALMRLMMTAGALACGASVADRDALARFGEHFGQAYQICDDLLDEYGESGLTGKTARQDARHLRLTALTAYGTEEAHMQAAALMREGSAQLNDRFGARAEVRLLTEAADAVIEKIMRRAADDEEETSRPSSLNASSLLVH